MASEAYQFDSDNFSLKAELGADDIIYLEIGGVVTVEHIEEFQAWGSTVMEYMVAMKKKHPDRVLTLIDISKLESFDVATTKALRALMSFNRNYATKTAVWGASPVARAVLGALVILTHRYTMKPFAGRDEAMAWLLDDTIQPKPEDLENLKAG